MKPNAWRPRLVRWETGFVGGFVCFCFVLVFFCVLCFFFFFPGLVGGIVLGFWRDLFFFLWWGGGAGVIGGFVGVLVDVQHGFSARVLDGFVCPNKAEVYCGTLKGFKVFFLWICFFDLILVEEFHLFSDQFDSLIVCFCLP